MERAHELAARLDFGQSSEDDVGRLLAVLAAGVPEGGRILELGTGCGVGLAWICEGVADCAVEVVSIEADEGRAQATQALGWPNGVRFMEGDAVSLLPSLGSFELIFADAQGGKWRRLDLTVAALRPHGLLVVDDMRSVEEAPEEVRSAIDGVRLALVDDARLVCAELAWSSGVILAARR